jgi:type II secretory pathway pseudopilin PulG
MGRPQLEDGVTMQVSTQKGFSLVETLISIGVLTTGVLGAAAVMATGMQNLSSSPSDVVVTQKATQAIETVFSARDSHKLTWSQINNVSKLGIFIDGPTSLTTPGNDGLLNTSDDGPIETVDLPGHIVTLSEFTREIKITDVVGANGQLKEVVVTITYQNGRTKRTYTLTTLMSAYS